MYQSCVLWVRLDVSPVPLNGIELRVVLGKEDAYVTGVLEDLLDFVELGLESPQVGEDPFHAASLPPCGRPTLCRGAFGGRIMLSWPLKGASPAPGDGRSCCWAGFGFLETALPSGPRLPTFFFFARPLGFPMVLVCVLCVVRAAVCAVFVYRVRPPKKKVAAWCGTTTLRLSRQPDFSQQNHEIPPWRLTRGIVCRALF